MLNLLPKDYREKVRREYIRRFCIILLVGFSLIDLFLIVAIFPSYTSEKMRKNIAEETMKSLKESAKVKDKNAILSNINDLEARLKAVAMVSGDKPTDYIDKVLEYKSQGIYIKKISYIKKVDAQKEISLEGVASTRTNLTDFSKKLKSLSWATSSEIPLSKLASDKSIQFLVTLTATSTPK